MAKVATKKKRLIILDTHAILHRAYHALPDFSSSKGESTGGLYGLISMLVKIINDLKPDYLAAAIDLPGGTFRHAAYEQYKGTRGEVEDALVSQLKRAPEVLEALGIPVYSYKGFEADDVIGTIVEKLKKNNGTEIVIASGDMDTLQLVRGDDVRVFTLRKGLTDTVLYDERAVEARFGFGPAAIPDYKGLRGDPSDNIPGVKGVGEKTATILISEFGDIDTLYKEIKKNPEKVLAAGCKEGMLEKLKEQEEEARFSRLLSEIRRDVPIDFALPKKTWREAVEAERALDMLAQFDFRTLMPRVKQLLGAPAEVPSQKVLGSPVSQSASSADSRGPDHFVQEPPPTLEVPLDELRKAALAVWVLDSNITNPELEDVLRAGKSKDFTEAFDAVKKELKKRELEFVFEKIELPLMPVLRRMEERGVLIDKGALAKLSKEYSKELERIALRIYKHAGEEFNIGSPKQLGDVLFDKLSLGGPKLKKTAGGQRSTRESELQKLKDAHPIIEDILSYRELSKLLSTYIDTIPTLLDKNNRLHTTFVQTGTSTGRLGSQNPNLQNIPIKSELGRAIRHAFVADEGHTLLSFDYSQIELRIAAVMSGDKALIDIFKSGRDVHTEVAARVFGKRSDLDAYEQRRRAKVINFGILYGMGVTSLQQALGTKRAEAQEFYEQYFAAFPRLAAYIDEVKADAARTGFTKTLFGRRRHFDGIRSSIPYVRAAAERMAVNAPIQGTATGDIPKLAMIKIDEFLREGEKGHLLLQVHDELVFEIKESKVKECVPKIQELMEHVLDEKQSKGVPITVEGKIGKNWGEMQKLDA